jgi:hypothetical protein
MRSASRSHHVSDDSFRQRIETFLSEYYFDTQGIPLSKLSAVIDEAALAKILTKLAVGSATVWWSLLEIKEIVSLYRNSRKNRSL